jgi:hypothetical protein
MTEFVDPDRLAELRAMLAGLSPEARRRAAAAWAAAQRQRDDNPQRQQ